MLSLIKTDFGARMYNPTIGRWNGVDALAEKYAGIGGYVYVAGNPVKLVDVDGRDFVIGTNEQTRKDVKSLGQSYSHFISIDEQGSVSINYSSQEAKSYYTNKKGVFNEKRYKKDIEKSKSHIGMKLLLSLTDSENKYYYSSESTVLTFINKSDKESYTWYYGESGKRVTDNSWFQNLSTTNRGDSHEDFLPLADYDGAVYIRPGSISNSFLETNGGYPKIVSKVVPRTSYIFHELAENYFRTENKDNYPTAHQKAINLEYSTNPFGNTNTDGQQKDSNGRAIDFRGTFSHFEFE